ncbi:MAG: cob(I)yrinic acid a,c-diamide adenosyltransferase [Alphaproteobacteria bacterium GM202ARS2]|nr:cob(I)yrinic acid a,c-diamide adenosyltransferase [Alphaproteobacteria bacterium GM202ARS2]
MTTEKTVTTEDINQRANRKSAARKRVQDKEVASKKKRKKGLLIVHSGNGKGKSTAAFGLCVRALGNGMRVAVVQFTKGKWRTGERTFFEGFGDAIVFKSMGEGFTWETQDRQGDIQAAEKAWEQVEAFLAEAAEGVWQLLVLDELNSILRYGYLDEARVVRALMARPPPLHVVVTGRGAPKALLEQADTVTEMVAVKHAYRDGGVRAQKGIEF